MLSNFGAKLQQVQNIAQLLLLTDKAEKPASVQFTK